MAANNRKPKEKKLRLGGYLLFLTIGAHRYNESLQDWYFQFSDGIRHQVLPTFLLCHLQQVGVFS